MERLELSRAPALSGVLILRTTRKTPGLISIVSIARDVDDSGWQWLCAQQEALLPAHYKGVHATVWTTVALLGAGVYGSILAAPRARLLAEQEHYLQLDAD